jgi:ADP-ribose pyrophosphatase
MTLPPFAPAELVTLEDLTPSGQTGFLRVHRRRMRIDRPGAASASFVFDHIHRDALDAVVIAAHYRDAAGELCVYLRSALRPAVRLRPLDRRPFEERATLGQLWELPAGLVEPGEYDEEGLRRCAARETAEELGFHLSPEHFRPLGPATFPSPGCIGERHHFFHVRVAPGARATPCEDGSALEEAALVEALAVAEALALARRGELEDAKTELALRRLLEIADV